MEEASNFSHPTPAQFFGARKWPLLLCMPGTKGVQAPKSSLRAINCLIQNLVYVISRLSIIMISIESVL